MTGRKHKKNINKAEKNIQSIYFYMNLINYNKEKHPKTAIH